MRCKIFLSDEALPSGNVNPFVAAGLLHVPLARQAMTSKLFSDPGFSPVSWQESGLELDVISQVEPL